MTQSYYLDTPTDLTLRRQSAAWLGLALTSLVIGGLFVILVVLSRTPGIQDIIPWVDFFKTALVVHVDMTVLVWFLAFAGVLWSFNNKSNCSLCGWAPIGLAAMGMLGMTTAPFIGEGNPLMNNYVPVLQNTFFITSLGLFGLGFAIQIFNGLVTSHSVGKQMDGPAAMRFGLYTALVAALLAVVSVIWSYVTLPGGLEGERFYELLFWGGGHVLQFTHTLLMMVVWLWLATVSGVPVQGSPRIVILLFVLSVVPVLLAPVIYILYSIESAEYIIGFADLMKYGGGLGVLPLGLLMLVSLKAANRPDERYRAERSALFYSILLFGVGGIIGFMISGSNVRIPAHYHGSIVGVTIAFMGITYYLLPRLGFQKPLGKWALRQPTIYGVGQLLWVLAMAYTGGHGVQRKTAGAEQALKNMGDHIAMGIMGIGGVVAIVGGIIFLVVVFKAIAVGKSQTLAEN